MATISRANIPEESILNFMKFKTSPDLFSGLKEFIDPIPLSNIEIPKNVEDVYHEITILDKDRLDLISYKYYGVEEYWWIIALANDIFDPFSDLDPGDYIRIPDQNTVYEILRKYRQVEEG